MTSRKQKSNTKPTTKDDIIEKVKNNHVWLNAFACVNPTDDYCREVGKMILEMLDTKENLLPNYNGDVSDCSEDLKETLQRMAELTPVLYLSINKS